MFILYYFNSMCIGNILTRRRSSRLLCIYFNQLCIIKCNCNIVATVCATKWTAHPIFIIFYGFYLLKHPAKTNEVAKITFLVINVCFSSNFIHIFLYHWNRHFIWSSIQVNSNTPLTSINIFYFWNLRDSVIFPENY